MLEVFRALAEPSRLQIVDLLCGEPLPVGSVAERLGIRQPQASKHLRALTDAGLLEVRHDAQRRIYALRGQPFRDLDIWLSRYRTRFEEQFDKLDSLLEELKLEERKKSQSPKKRLPAKPRLRS